LEWHVLEISPDYLTHNNTKNKKANRERLASL